jgi:WD40 repeat protein
MSTHEQMQTFGSDSRISALEFNPDGSVLASGGSDGKVLLWNPDTGEEIGAALEQASDINALAFSPDGSTLAAAVSKIGVVLWSVGTRH